MAHWTGAIGGQGGLGPMTTVVCPVLVGRDDSVRRLEASLERMVGTGLVCIAGEAGIGKSRMGRDAVQLARQRGMAVLTGAASQEASIPYAPFVSALRRHTRSLPDADVRALFDGRATLAAGLLPELGQEAPPLGASHLEDLFASVWHVLARVARPAGALLLLEDVHWADADSLRLLAYLAEELVEEPVWAVATYRSDELHRRHPLLPVLSDLERRRLSDVIDLEPLDAAGVGLMLSAMFEGAPVSEEFTTAVLEQTNGNPFFIEELAKTLVDGGDVFRAGGEWDRRALADMRLPATVREALLTRFRQLPDEPSWVLSVAACAGERVDAEVLAAGVGDRDVVEDALVEGLERQLLVEDAGPAGRSYRFRHALTREAVAEETIGPARARAHRQIADGLLAIHGDSVDQVAAELAHHLDAAGDRAGAAAFALIAARRAGAAASVEESGRWFATALRLSDFGDAERLAVLLEAASLTFSPSDWRAAATYADEARRLAKSLSDSPSEAEAIWTVQQCVYRQGETRRAVELLEEAQRLVTGRDPYREAWTLTLLARLYVLTDRPEDAGSLVARGEALARSCGHLRAIAGLCGCRLLMAESDEEAEAAYREGLSAAKESGDVYREINLAEGYGYSAVWKGQLATGRDRLADAVELGRLRHPRAVAYSEVGLAWACSLTGEYDKVKQIMDGVTAKDAPTRLVGMTALTEVAERCGDDAEVRQLLEQQDELAKLSAEAQRLVPAESARARLVARTEGGSAAWPLFQDVFRLTTNQRGRGSHWMFSPEAAWSLAAGGLRADLDQWCEAVEALTERDSHPQNRAAALLCAAARLELDDDLVAARARLDEAAELFAAMPYPARHVETLLRLGDVVLRLGDDSAARAYADDARREATAIGARRLVGAAQDLLDRADGESVVATIAFTDIVDSTKRAAAEGDAAWTRLLDRHNAVVRRELQRHGGTEIDTAGDGFCVSFTSPTRAVRFGLDVIGAVSALGLDLRVGIHTGECRRSGVKLAGVAVHIAARIAGQAGPGEVLVSSTVQGLVAGSGIAFTDRGVVELKGVEQRWQLFSPAGAVES